MPPSEGPLLASSISLPRRAWLNAAIEHHRREIVLRGWHWFWPKAQNIPIRTVTRVDIWTLSQGPNFWLRSEEGIGFRPDPQAP